MYYYWPRPHSQAQMQTWLQRQLHLVFFQAGLLQPVMPHSHPPASRALPRLREELWLLFTSNLTPPISSKTIWTKFLFWRCVSHSVVSNSLWPHGLLACQFPLSMEFFRQEYWSALPFPSLITPTQGLSQGLLYCRQIFYCVSHQGNPAEDGFPPKGFWETCFSIKKPKEKKNLQTTNWKSKSLSRVRLFVTSWTIKSMEFSRPEYWSG